jgi:hypothetical protein
VLFRKSKFFFLCLKLFGTEMLCYVVIFFLLHFYIAVRIIFMLKTELNRTVITPRYKHNNIGKYVTMLYMCISTQHIHILPICVLLQPNTFNYYANIIHKHHGSRPYTIIKAYIDKQHPIAT